MTPPKRAHKRRHHNPSKFYLRSFADSDGMVWTYDQETGRVSCAKPENTGVVRDAHSTLTKDQLRDTNTVEDCFSEIEGKAASAVEKLLKRESLEDQDRFWFSMFVSMQYLRSPAARRQLAELLVHDYRLKMNLTAQVDSEFERYLARIQEKVGPVSDERQIELRKVMLDPDGEGYEFEVAKESTLFGLIQLTEVARAICWMSWTLLEMHPSFGLITCDSPVFLFVPPAKFSPLNGFGFNFNNPFIEVSFPLSPKICWMASWPDDAKEYLQVETHVGKFLNRLRAVNAERFLFASVNSADIQALARECRGPYLKLDPGDDFGFSGKPFDVSLYKFKDKGLV